MMTEDEIKSEIERHQKLLDYAISAKDPIEARKHRDCIDALSTVIHSTPKIIKPKSSLILYIEDPMAVDDIRELVDKIRDNTTNVGMRISVYSTWNSGKKTTMPIKMDL